MTKTKFLSITPVLVLLAALACGSSDGGQPSAATEDDPAVALPTVRPDRVPLIEGPKLPDGLKAILGTADLGVGPSRLGFVLVSPNGFVTDPEVSVSSIFYGGSGSEGEPQETVTAGYQPWPFGSRGLYATTLDFHKVGRWGIDILVGDPEGTSQTVQLFFQVNESPAAPAIGDAAVRSKTKTVDDVASVEELSTGSQQDPDLYQTSLDAALDSGLPTVVVFASPAFCTNAVCGPQVETLGELKDKYTGRANFVHVDFYDNPMEIQGDLDKAVLSPSVLEWGLPSIEWTFVIDADGKVSARFEAYVTFKELEEALAEVL